MDVKLRNLGKKTLILVLSVMMVLTGIIFQTATAFAEEQWTYDSATRTYTVSGDYIMDKDMVLNIGETFKVPEGCSLTIPAGISLSVPNKAWMVNDGNVIVKGELKSYGMTNFVKGTWPKGQFTILQGGNWYNKSGNVLYVGGEGAELQLLDLDSSMIASFIDGTFVMTAASGTIVQNTDKTLSSVLMPEMINRLIILEDATYQISEGKQLIVPSCGELVAKGTLEINGSVILEAGSEYTMKNGAVITLADEGNPVTLVSGETLVLPTGATASVGSVVLDAGQAKLELDGSVSMKNGDRITAQGDIVYHSVTIEAVAGKGGSISPSGKVDVEAGQDKTFTIKANDGYKISDVLVDNVSVGAISSYTFENISAGHTIEAVFSPVAVNTSTDNPINDGAKAPTTGDTSNMGLWIALLVLAAGTTGTVVYRKKTHK